MTDWVALALLIALLWLPHPAAAQAPALSAGSVHLRVDGRNDRTLDLANARLFVPRDAVAPGAIVGLGVGGVPAPDGSLYRTGVVVVAAGGLRAPVALLIAPTESDLAVIAGGVPALLDTASETYRPCDAVAGWIACTIPRVGAYVIDVTTEPPAADPLLRQSLATLPADTDVRPRQSALLVVVAALAAGATVLLLGRWPAHEEARSGADR